MTPLVIIQQYLNILISTIQIKALEKKHKKAKGGDGGGEGGRKVAELNPQPQFLTERLELFHKLKKEQDERLAAKTNEPIKVTLPDGKVVDGLSWKTTPYDVAAGISKG